MKAKERALTEWVTDEIEFDGKVYTRKEFEEQVSRTLFVPQDSDPYFFSVPLLEGVLHELKKTFEAAHPRTFEAAWKNWLVEFFAPQNLMRYVSRYDVKEGIKRKKIKLAKSMQVPSSTGA